MHVESHDHARFGRSEPLRGILIIGGTSDLSRRHLLPALTRLLLNDELPEAFSVTLTGLEPMCAEDCRRLIAEALTAHASDLPSDARQALAERISYLQADVLDSDALRAISTEPALIYIATPPDAVPAALEGIAAAGLHRSARIVFDKPFGHSRRSAQALNMRVKELVEESRVYRIDHFLYHHTVQQLVRRRVESDPLALADALPVAEVEIRWDETRTAPPSGTKHGVMRDMIQSHLLQLAAVISMDAPASLTRADLARNRLEALRGMASTDGTSQPASATLAVRSEMPRWREVPFVLRAAKGARESRRHVEFRLAGSGFVRLEVLAGRVVVMPAGADAPLELALSPDPETASTRLLRAALAGDDTFTLSAEEPEEAWRIVEGHDE